MMKRNMYLIRQPTYRQRQLPSEPNYPRMTNSSLNSPNVDKQEAADDWRLTQLTPKQQSACETVSADEIFKF